MADILLSTLNARYTHAAIGLRYLFANLHELQPQAQIVEFTINDALQDIAERILAKKPKIIALGVYIWNAQQTSELLHILKRVAPDIPIVLGGPEVSYEPLRVNFDAADYIIRGEAEVAFYTLCRALLQGKAVETRIIDAGTVALDALELPYRYYTDEDVKHRYIYVEASRGCPFSCEFCLSSMDNRVRNLFIEQLLQEFELLWQRGVRSFKFIDRTFNLNPRISNQILDFFLMKDDAYFAHFEVIPDHFPQSIKERIPQFPPASLQLEVGIQTMNAEVAARVHRKLNLEKIKENIAYLSDETQAHMHLDLIVGLPGESLESFGMGLNQLCALTDAEIQIGILKKLSGTALARHDDDWGMVYSDIPPYDILKNSVLSFADIQHMKRFARFWDLYRNSGNFKTSLGYVYADDVFQGFSAFTHWVYAQTQSTWKISLDRLATLLFDYVVQVQGQDAKEVAECLAHDVMKIEGRVLPNFLKPWVTYMPKTRKKASVGLQKRQQRHAV